MNKEKMFVIGDVHGEITMLEELLKHWKPEDERLLFVGDLTDRGENSKETLERVYELHEKENAVVVKGNHDEMLQKFLENPSEHMMLYYMNGGGSTVNELLGRNVQRHNYQAAVDEIKERYPWILPFLKSLPLYYEWGDYLFVHAGVDMNKKNWRDSSNHDFVWIREGFYDQPNTTDKKIIFGHTVTSMLHGDMNKFDIWASGDGLFGIDGGAVYGGHLHGLVLEEDQQVEHYVIENTNKQF